MMNQQNRIKELEATLAGMQLSKRERKKERKNNNN